MDALLAKRQEIADRIKVLLKEKGWTQYHLADELKVSRSYITRLLAIKGETSPPTLTTLVKLETVLGGKILEIPRSTNSEQAEPSM